MGNCWSQWFTHCASLLAGTASAQILLYDLQEPIDKDEVVFAPLETIDKYHNVCCVCMVSLIS